MSKIKRIVVLKPRRTRCNARQSNLLDLFASFTAEVIGSPGIKFRTSLFEPTL